MQTAEGKQPERERKVTKWIIRESALGGPCQEVHTAHDSAV